MPINIQDPEYHLGHLFMDLMRRRPDAICQIDAATGEQETNASVLARSVALARCFRKLDLKPGDVLALGGRNHLHLHIPYYAALMNGLPIVGVDPFFKYDEIKSLFQLTEPKIAFCDNEHYDMYIKVVENLQLGTKVVTFDGDTSMNELISIHRDDTPLNEFKPEIFDLNKIYAWLVSTGGTSGTIKLAAFTHKTWIKKAQNLTEEIMKHMKKLSTGKENESGPVIGLHLSPVQWLSAYFNAIGMPLMNQTKLQTSAPPTPGHVIDIVHKYKPSYTMWGTSIVAAILRLKRDIDLTSLKVIVISGSKTPNDHLIELRKKASKDAVITDLYGLTETLGMIFSPNPHGPLGSCGQNKGSHIKLVDPETGKEITEAHVPGELLFNGDRLTEYYNNPEETAKAFDEDGWFKTGDILYRDEDYNFFFVDRLKMLIKYKNHHVMPLELEDVIRTHKGVLAVAVTSVPHPIDVELPVACVVREEGSNVTAQEIKDLVASKLSDMKRLSGGVVFLDKIPFTSTGKIARGKLQQMVLTLQRE